MLDTHVTEGKDTGRSEAITPKTGETFSYVPDRKFCGRWVFFNFLNPLSWKEGLPFDGWIHVGYRRISLPCLVALHGLKAELHPVDDRYIIHTITETRQCR